MINLNNVRDQMKAIVEAMKDENLSDEDFNKYEAEYNELESAVKRDEKLRGIISGPGPMNGKFSNLGEFVNAVVDVQVRHNPMDSRLAELRATQSMGEATAGGFMVPTAFRPELLQVEPQEGIFRPRATVIPADSAHPDSECTCPTLNQTSDENVYGGIVVEKTGEGKTKNLTDFQLKELSLIPHEVSGYIVATDKLLRNWPGSTNIIGGLMKKAIIGWEDTQFYSGNGVAGPHGLIYSGAVINYARAAAGAVSLADIQGMVGRFTGGPNGVWIASPTVKTQLMVMTDGTNYVWAPGGNVIGPTPPSLYGYPVMWADRSPGLGSTGDLALVDPSFYLVKDGFGPVIAASEHVYFTSNKTVIKVFWNVDGAAWLTEPIPLEGSTSDTVSPFVILE